MPLFNYAGGKTRLIPFYDDVLDSYNLAPFENFYELFGGTGAFVEHFADKRKDFAQNFHYNELSKDLFRVLEHTRTHTETVVEGHMKHVAAWNAFFSRDPRRNEYYGSIRERYRGLSDAELAEPKNTGDLLFLFSMMFHGIFKVCKEGKILTTAGDLERDVNTTNALVKIKRFAHIWKNIRMTNGSFEDVVIAPNSFVFCDPPYAESRLKYGAEKIFCGDKTDDMLLWCGNLAKEKNCFVMLANAEHDKTTFRFTEENTFGGDIYRCAIERTIMPSAVHNADEVLVVWDGRKNKTPRKTKDTNILDIFG